MHTPQHRRLDKATPPASPHVSCVALAVCHHTAPFPPLDPSLACRALTVPVHPHAYRSFIPLTPHARPRFRHFNDPPG